MAKDKFDQKWLAIPLVLALVIIMAQSGMLVGLGVGAQPGTPAAGGAITTTGTGCPFDYTTIVGVYAVESVKDTDGKETVVSSGTADVYRDGDTLAYDTITLSGSGYAFSTSGKELTCGSGDDFGVIVGGASYYYNNAIQGETRFDATHAKENLKFVLDKVGTFAVTADTATEFGKASGTIANVSIAKGATYTDMKVKVAEASGGVIRAPTIFVNYNTSAFDTVEVIGGTKVATIPKRYSGNEEGYKVTDDSIINYGNVVGQLKIVAKSGVARAEETITLTVSDFGNFVSEGQIVDGYENLSNADIGATDATYTFTVAAAA